MITLDPRSTALVLIDLQSGILALDTAPRTGAEILAGAIPVARQFRDAGAPVVLVRVAFAPDWSDAPPNRVDRPQPHPEGGMPAGWSDLADGLAGAGDVVVTKRHWGAFTGTDLDLQLRRRGVRTVVLGGIATNIGVESTLRSAWEHGYDAVVAEDLCATFSSEMHRFALDNIFPRLARIAPAAEIRLAGA